MPSSKDTKPVKTRSTFGKLLDKLPGRKSEPSREEVNKQAQEKWRQDRAAVQELKNQLLGAGAPIPALIAQALADPDSKLPPLAQLQVGQEKATQALAAKEAVAAYVKGYVDVQIGKDKAGLLEHGGHVMIANSTAFLDRIKTTADQRWQTAATTQSAAEHAQFLTQSLARIVQLRDQSHAKLAEVSLAISQAEKGIAKVSGLGLVDVSELTTMVVQARQAFNAVTESSELPTVLEKVLGWEGKLKVISERGAKPLAKLASYRKLRQSVQDDIGKASLLRGATEDTPLRELLNSARIDIGLADEGMAKAESADMIDRCTGLLEQYKDLLARAKKIDADLKLQAKTDLEALPKYTAAMQALAQAREKMAGMAGADAQVNAADIAMAAGRLGLDGRPTGGYAAALKLLEGKAKALLEEATKVSTEFVKGRTSTIPGLAKLEEQARDRMLSFVNVHPPAQAGAQQEALAKALTDKDPTAALNALIVKWNNGVTSQGEIDKLLMTEMQRMSVLVGKLDKLHPSAATMAALRNTEPVTRLRQANEFAQALALAQRATQAADDYLLVAVDLNDKWTTAASALKAATVQAARWAEWPPLSGAVRNIMGDVQRTLDAVAKGADLPGALEAAGRIQQRVAALQQQASTAGLDPAVDLNAYKMAAEKASSEWALAMLSVSRAVDALAEALRQAGAGAGAESTSWHQQLDALGKRWQEVMANPKLAKGQSPTDALAKTLEQFKAEALLIQKGAVAAATDKNQMAPLLEAAQGKDKELALRKLHAELVGMVQRLESAGSKTAEMWAAVGREFDPATAPRKEATWKKLGPMLEPALEKRRTELLALRIDGVTKADELDKRLKKLFDSNKDSFPGFFEDLQGRSSDARAMLLSPDPTLMDAGLKQLEQMASQLTQARKGGESESGEALKTFDDVSALWKQLSKQVGLEVVMKRLPATYKRLYGQLMAATDNAKSLPPQEGWALLEALRVPIDDAVAQAERVAERYAIFKARREQLEGKLVELHKMTSTRFTEKTEAYNAKFDTRMADAKAMAKQEGQMAAAFGLLDALDKELADLMASPDTARAELQKLDTAAAAEQRELRDLARTWEASNAYWKDTLLPQVKKAMAKRGDDNTSEFESLEGAVKQTGAPLKGYLGVISSWPHEYLATNASPDIKQARNAFASAQARLGQMQRTANRLINGGGSTNVDLESDLGKLENEWVSRVQKMHGAMNRLADAIRKVPDEASADKTDAEHYLEPQVLGQLRTASNVVGRSVPELATRFAPSAFAVPMATLRSPSSSPPERKTAREDVLRTMRRLRDEIVNSPLFKQLFDGAASGALSVDVRPELSMLRASLKKIELAVLVAV